MKDLYPKNYTLLRKIAEQPEDRSVGEVFFMNTKTWIPSPGFTDKVDHIGRYWTERDDRIREVNCAARLAQSGNLNQGQTCPQNYSGQLLQDDTQGGPLPLHGNVHMWRAP